MESARRDGAATIAGSETVTSDEELVGRFRDHGDRDALSELIRRYAPRLRRLLYSLARNRTIDLIRARSRDRARVTRSEDPDTAPDPFAGPERLLDDRERASLVRTVLRRLAPEDQFLLYMKDGEGVRLEELVEITGRPSGTVKSRLARARRKLARHLEEMGYEHE